MAVKIMLKLDLQPDVVGLIKPENYFNRRSDYRTFPPFNELRRTTGSWAEAAVPKNENGDPKAAAVDAS